MSRRQHLSRNEEETMNLAGRMAAFLKAGDILCLIGELGSGKTVFTKGLARGLRIAPRKVHSPTFILMNMYEGLIPLYHFDLYRLDEENELALIGYEEFFYGEGVAVIEWADKLKSLRPKRFLEVRIRSRKAQERLFTFVPHGKRYRELLDEIG